MADHYRVLGVTKNATKQQIKEAFRKLAIQFHPDKHAQSSKSTKDAATVKFKQVSEAYEVLIDDRKRAAYNLSYNNGGNFYSARSSGSYGYGNTNANYNANYYYNRGGGSYYKQSYRASSNSNSNRWASNLDAAFRYMTTREFLRSVIFAGILLVGIVAVDMSGDTLWKMQNTGKSFEETMESIHNKKTKRDKE